MRFLFATRPDIMGQVLGIVYRVIATHLIKKAGLTHRAARTGAVTLIQRFGSALNLNIHFHMLFLDGVYIVRPDARGWGDERSWAGLMAGKVRTCTSDGASKWAQNRCLTPG